MTDDQDFVERRQFERFPLMLEAEVSLGSDALASMIFDVSAGGAKVRFKDDPFKKIVLKIPPFGEFEGEVVWKDDEYVGIKFGEDHEKMMDVIVDMTRNSQAAKDQPDEEIPSGEE
jgi:hypothetical protein